jgi:hypothetical protein
MSEKQKLKVSFCSRCGWTCSIESVQSNCPNCCMCQLTELEGTQQEINTKIAITKIYIDEIVTISLEATELIQRRLKKLGVRLTPLQEDEIYIPLSTTLEKYSNGNYRHDH